jgi:hypothetical protein
VTRAQALLLLLLLLPAVDLDEAAALLLPHRLRRFFRDAVFLVCRACSLLGNVVSGLDEAVCLLLLLFTMSKYSFVGPTVEVLVIRLLHFLRRLLQHRLPLVQHLLTLENEK